MSRRSESTNDCKDLGRESKTKLLLQTVSYLAHIAVNLVCSILCVTLYSMVFYKYFHLQKSSSDGKAKSYKGELSLICIGATIFAVNVLFTVFGLLTIAVLSTGGDPSGQSFTLEVSTIV